jgi:hypothetical protein
MSQLVKTKRQANFKDFKRFGAFKGLVEEKTLYLPRSYVNLHTNSLNKVLTIYYNNNIPGVELVYET